MHYKNSLIIFKLKQSVKTAKEAIDDINKQGSCYELKQSNGWKYKVCLGGTITQVLDASLSFKLGEYSHFDETNKMQVYNNGQTCDAIGAPRKTNVHFVCASNAGIQSVEEPSTCVYKVVLSFPELCDHPDFLKQEGVEQPWYLQLVSSDYPTSHVLCSAGLATTKPNKDLKISQFSLDVSSLVSITDYTVR